jgi:hypothetical protein
MAKILIEGRDVTVSDLWHDQVVKPHWPPGINFTFDKLEAARLGLRERSNSVQLSPEQTRLLADITHIRNVANTLKVVGAEHDPAEWGLEGWDAVKGNYEHFECGCSTLHVHDHHSVFNHWGHNRVKDDVQSFTVSVRRVCPGHARLANDPERLNKQARHDQAQSSKHSDD